MFFLFLSKSLVGEGNKNENMFAEKDLFCNFAAIMKQFKELPFSKLLLTNVALTIVATVACHVLQRYILFDIEQTRVFVYEWDKIADQLAGAGGVADCLALFAQQFFRLEYAGPAIMAMVMLLTALCMQGVCSSVSFAPELGARRPVSVTLTEGVLCWLPSALLFVYTEDGIFFTTGHFAILLSVFGLWIYACLLSAANKFVRWALIPLLVLATGFACSTAVWPMIAAMVVVAVVKKNYVDCALIPLSAVLMVGLGRYFSLATNETELFSPDVFTYRNRLDTVMDWVWAAIVLVTVVVAVLNRWRNQKVMNSMITAGVVLVAGFFFTKKMYEGETSIDTNQRLALQRNLDTGNYEEAYDFAMAYKENAYMSNIMFYIRSLNGDLVQAVTLFGPRDPQALIMKSNPARIIRRHLMSFYYYLGYIYGAQCQAFEYNEPTEGMMVPEAVKLLAKTNIIMGNYAVAEKYLSHLENTIFYSDWAKDYRKFLYNDRAVEADKELGPRRKGLNIESVPDHKTLIVDVIRLIANASPELPAKQYKDAMLQMGVYNYLKPEEQ